MARADERTQHGSIVLMTSPLPGFLLVAALLIGAHPVSAQHAAPVGVRRSVAPSEFSRLAVRDTAARNGSRLQGAANGALIGAAIGTTAGLLVAATAPHHYSDQLATNLIVGGTFGAFFGLIIGGMIGAVRAR